MISVATERSLDAYISWFGQSEKGFAERGPAWLAPVRHSALARFEELGFPTTRDEEWRWTNVSGLAGTAFEPAPDRRSSVTADDLRAFWIDGAATAVFVNGRFAPALSALAGLPAGLTVGGLAAALADGDRAVEAHLSRYAAFADQFFVALNTALFEDGAYVRVPRGLVVERPIHLLLVTVASDGPTVAHPRLLIVADPNSQATIIESHVTLGSGTHWTNAVNEVVAGENAVIDHYRVQRESDDGYHISTLALHMGRASNVTSSGFCLGGGLTRNDINPTLDGEGGDCHLRGLYMVDGDQHVDHHLVVVHAQPHCDSREFYKGILEGRGRGIFSGKIIVREGAQKTDAKQTNMSLLLSDEAQVESKPQLEIFADDVKCTHGATIGQVDGDAVFYLRSRGIPAKAARDLLVYAFARELVAEVKVEPLRRSLEALVLQRLPQGRLLEDMT